MDRRQFSTCIMELTREGFPELYEKHIKGRRREFIAEHAPELEPNEETGEVLGRLPEYLQILWAIAEMLYEHGLKRWPKNPRKRTAEGICREVAWVNSMGFGTVVELGFWESVMDLFEAKVYPRAKTLRMNPDWTVSLVSDEEAPKRYEGWDKFARLAKIGMVAAGTRDELNVALKLLKSKS